MTPPERPFRYQPGCGAPGCNTPALYKIAASWSDGSSRELKNYGLACDQHRDQELAAARRRHDRLPRSEHETVAPVELYRLIPGSRDRDLEPLTSKRSAPSLTENS
jgi:hypothetical protein